MIVISAVFKLLSDPIANHHPQIIRTHGQITLIEQGMQVASQKQAVLRFVGGHPNYKV
jgi:hypothetical protein